MLNAALDRIVWPQEDNRIPREVFIDKDLYHVEMDRVFTGPVWVLVAHEAEIPEVGDYKTMDLGEVPILIVRGRDGAVRGFVNACAHRGARLVEQPFGNAARTGLRCIYHMWTYNTEGELTGVALPEDFPQDFCKEDYGLPRVRVDTYRGAIFATLNDDTPPLPEYLAELQEGLDVVLRDGRLRYLGAIKVVFHTNWKLYVENIYDGYHVTALHTGFQILKLRSYGGERFVPNYERNGHLWSRSRSRLPERPVLRDMSILEVRTKEEACHNMMVVFPTGVVTDYFDTIQLRYVIPRDVDRTEIHFAFFAREGDSEAVVRQRLRQGPQVLGPAGAITMEDAVALERVQLSATARGENVVLKGTPKRFPPYRHVDEAPIRHLYQAYRRLLGY